MDKKIKKFADWKKNWKTSTNLKELTDSLDHIDELYEDVRNSLGRMLMSAEMLEIQEILEDRIEELKKKKADKEAA